MDKKFHREITPLAPEDSFQVFDRVKDDFDFPIHFHPEYELNFISNGKGVRRIVGDSLEEIDDIELVLVGPNIEHCWELYKCTSKSINEITIQFHNDLFDEKMLSRRIFKPIKDMFDRSNYGIVFSKKIAFELQGKIKALSKIDSIDYLMELISILQDLANSRNQRLLSTYTSQNKTFENSDKIKKVYEYILKWLSNMSKGIKNKSCIYAKSLQGTGKSTLPEFLRDWVIGRDCSCKGKSDHLMGQHNLQLLGRVFVYF